MQLRIHIRIYSLENSSLLIQVQQTAKFPLHLTVIHLLWKPGSYITHLTFQTDFECVSISECFDCYFYYLKSDTDYCHTPTFLARHKHSLVVWSKCQ